MANIRFVEKTHQYLSDEGELISVSALMDKFKAKKDWTEIARKFAIKESKRLGKKVTTKEIQKLWKDKADQSASVGTLYHNIRESELINEKNSVFYGKLCKKGLSTFIDGTKWSIPISNIQNNTIYPELMIYCSDHMVCGQSDKVIVVNNTINIWDYKTDKEIKFKAFSSEWTKPEKLLPPLSHIDNANGNLYALKMSMYMYLLWKANNGRFKPGEIKIEHIHLKRDKDTGIPVLEKGKPVVLKREIIKLPYLKKEVMAMLATLKPSK